MDLIALREEKTRQYGAMTMDTVMASYACRQCGQPVTDPNLRLIGFVGYRDIDSLVETARNVARAVPEQEQPHCESCRAAASVVAVDYHTFHSGAGKDLVVRCFLDQEPDHRFFWSDTEHGYVPIADLEDDFAHTLTRDACLRAAAVTLDAHGSEMAYQLIQEALYFYPGDPALLTFIDGLLQDGKADLSGAIAEAHVAAHPEDPAGHYWLGEIVYQIVAHGVWPPEKLMQADLNFKQALTLDPGYLPAEIGQCRLAHLEGRFGAAQAGMERLLQKHPDNPEVHYRLAQMDLEDRPHSALEHFARAGALDPAEPKYPIGCIESLLRLGQKDEARRLLESLKDLYPGHPYLDDLESQMA